MVLKVLFSLAALRLEKQTKSDKPHIKTYKAYLYGSSHEVLHLVFFGLKKLLDHRKWF